MYRYVFWTKSGRIKYYKKIYRRKKCPKIIQDNCSKITECNKDIKKASKNYTEFKKTNKNIYKQARYLRDKLRKLRKKKYDIENTLDSIPIIYLLQDIIK